MDNQKDYWADKDLHEVDHYDEELAEVKLLKKYGYK